MSRARDMYNSGMLYQTVAEMLENENGKLQMLVQRMWPVFIGEKRATFADRLWVRTLIGELKVEIGQ